MEDKTIIDIPIYSEPEEVFTRRWNEYFEKSFIEYGGPDHNDHIARIRQIYYPENVWKYNRICGYIRVYLAHSDIYLDVYKCSKKRYPYRSRTKNFLTLLYISGNHFRVFDNNVILDNNQLRLKIIEKLEWLVKDNFANNRFVDLKGVARNIEYIDINKMCEDYL